MSADPDLPILDELRVEFGSLVAEDLGAGGSSPAHYERARLPPRPPARRRRGQAHRVARRAGIVLVLLCLVGGVALAARFGSSGDSAAAHTSPAVLGRSAAQSWAISGYRDQGRLCILLRASGEITSGCARQPGDALRSLSLIAGGRRLVGGLAPRRTAKVAVTIGTGDSLASTAPPIDPAAAKRAGVPAGMRWFVTVLPRPSRAPARLRPLDGRGRALGRPEVDCSLGVVGETCLRQVQQRAAAAVR